MYIYKYTYIYIYNVFTVNMKSHIEWQDTCRGMDGHGQGPVEFFD